MFTITSQGRGATWTRQQLKTLALRLEASHRLSTSDVSFPSASSANDIVQVNERYKGILEIRSVGDRGLGLVSQKSFDTGDHIMSARAVSVSDERHSHTIQKDWNKHVVMDLPAILINHSCNANVGIQDNDEAYDFYAIRSISCGEELTWDYETSEYEIFGNFSCQCGSPLCRGSSVLGYKTNEATIKKQYGEYYANYLKK